MDPTKSPEVSTTPQAWAAFAVHVFTATGAACALLALIAATGRDWPQMFIWLGIALVIDGIDGTFARYLKVAEVLPRWSGDILDLVVDILTYVFVPAYAIVASGLLPTTFATLLGLVIAMTGTLYFADRRMKTLDYYFRGFPALWNVAAFYLFLIKPTPAVAGTLVLALVALTFVPFHFVHPVRIPHLRRATLGALVLWSALAVDAIWAKLEPNPWVVVTLCLLAIYFVAIGFLRRHHP